MTSVLGAKPLLSCFRCPCNLLMQSHPDLQIVCPHGVFVELVVGLEADWDSYTLMDAERLRQIFISTYSLIPYSIAFSSAEEGTMVLKFWLRSECAPVTFHCKSQPIVDSRHSRILQITVDGIPYQFPQSQVVTVEVSIDPEFIYCGAFHDVVFLSHFRCMQPPHLIQVTSYCYSSHFTCMTKWLSFILAPNRVWGISHISDPTTARPSAKSILLAIL